MDRTPNIVLARFWAKVQKQPGDGCWLWVGSTSERGYGYFSTPSGTVQAHRWIYQQEHGQLSRGLTIDHLCRVRNCVRSSHMEPVTPRENVLRGIGISAKNARKTHCVRGHPLSGDNLYLAHGKRHCRTCRADNDKRRKAIKHGGRPHPRDRDACIHGHPYEPSNVKLNANGHRVCLICARAKVQRRNAKTSKGLGLPGLRTHCPQGHPYDEQNTLINGGSRLCRTCRNNAQRKRRANARLEI